MPALFIVSTPIGNLGDMTVRAIETLKSVDVIACEDTRRTRILLDHYHVGKPLVSFHEHNEQRAVERLRELCRAGKSVALVTDAGSPGISDPGFRLVRMAIEEGMEVTAVPGASALLPALALSGLPVHSFLFRGFPPAKPGARRRFFEQDRAIPHTLIYYVSPYKLVAALEDALAVFGDRRAALANDLTKKFEHVWRGPLCGILADLRAAKVLGEFTLLVAGTDTDERRGPDSEAADGDGPEPEPRAGS